MIWLLSSLCRSSIRLPTLKNVRMSRFFAFVSVDLDVEDAGEVRLDDEGVDDDVNTGAKKEPMTSSSASE